MSMLIACDCGREFLTEDGSAGSGLRCVECGRMLEIPADPASAENPDLVDEPVAAPFSGRSLASFLLGASSLFLTFPAGVPAIGLGIGSIVDIRHSRGRLRGRWLAMSGVALGFIGSTVMSYFWITKAARWIHESTAESRCSSNCAEILKGFWSYQTTHGRFPRAAIFDKNGRPLLSWRVAILPYLGPKGQALYNKFHLREPWDSPHNRALLDQMPEVYRCPGLVNAGKGMTNYQLFVGPGTIFNGRDRMKWEDLNTGKLTYNFLIEADRPVPWTAPLDVPYNAKDPFTMQGDHHSGWFHTSALSGRVQFRPWIDNDASIPGAGTSPPSKKTSAASGGK